MACCKIFCKRKLTKSECLIALKSLKKRLFSTVTAFKLTQLVVASAGMSLHICQPIYRNLLDSTLVPGVLCGFMIISCVLLIGHLYNCTAPIRLNAIFSTVAVIGYGWCMSAIMDSILIEGDPTAWGFLLSKGIVCFGGLASHLLELLHAFVTRDPRPRTLRSGPPSRTHSISATSQPVNAAHNIV